MSRRSLLGVLVYLATACATIPTGSERRAQADALAAVDGWQADRIATARFDLLAYLPKKYSSSARLAIYLEGDGFAWVSPTQASADPTPRDPLGLKLALAHPKGNAAYLARPCQYIDPVRTGCSQRYWTSARFAPETVEATNQAVDVLKQRFGARQLVLIGYSGGGTLAALVAKSRTDVERLVTVAGNLDVKAWAEHHRLTALAHSLDPADFIDSLQAIPQWHFVGGRDKIVPASLPMAFSARFPPAHRPVVLMVKEYDHSCCWAENWATLFGQLEE